MTPFGLLIAALALIFPGCSLKAPESSGVTLRFEHRALPKRKSILSSTPVYLTDFDCLAVNVIGSGIGENGSSSGTPEGILNATLNGSSCSYAGVVSQGFGPYSNAQIQLTVPPGPNRVIQVVGIDETDATFSLCNTTRWGKQSCGATAGCVEPAIYEVGRTVTDLFHDATVSVEDTFSILNDTERAERLTNCFSTSHCTVSSTYETTLSPSAFGSAPAYLDSSASEGYGQTIIPASDMTLRAIEISLSAQTATSDAQIQLETDSSVSPSGTLVANTDTHYIFADDLPLHPDPREFRRVTFSPPVQLQSGVTYWVTVFPASWSTGSDGLVVDVGGTFAGSTNKFYGGSWGAGPGVASITAYLCQ